MSLDALDALVHEVRLEAEITRRVLARLPADALAWTPDPKSRAAGELAAHVAAIPGLFLAGLEHDSLDRSSVARVPGDDHAAILASFDRNVAEAQRVLPTLAGARLLAPWRYTAGGAVIFELPRFVVARSTGLNHMIHHRGQLTVYLRLLGAAVPRVYGPSADEA